MKVIQGRKFEQEHWRANHILSGDGVSVNGLSKMLVDFEVVRDLILLPLNNFQQTWTADLEETVKAHQENGVVFPYSSVQGKLFSRHVPYFGLGIEKSCL